MPSAPSRFAVASPNPLDPPRITAHWSAEKAMSILRVAGTISTESHRGSQAGLGGLDFAVTRRRGRDQRVHELTSHLGCAVHGALEGGFVRMRRLFHAGRLAQEMERRRAHLVV